MLECVPSDSAAGSGGRSSRLRSCRRAAGSSRRNRTWTFARSDRRRLYTPLERRAKRPRDGRGSEPGAEQPARNSAGASCPSERPPRAQPGDREMTCPPATSHASIAAEKTSPQFYERFMHHLLSRSFPGRGRAHFVPMQTALGQFPLVSPGRARHRRGFRRRRGRRMANRPRPRVRREDPRADTFSSARSKAARARNSKA